METILLPASHVTILLRRSERRRTWSISVEPGGKVSLSVPARMSWEKINEILSKHEAWIHRRLKQMSRFPPINLRQNWRQGESFYFQGQHLTLRLERSHYGHVIRHDSELELRSPDFRPTTLKKITESWLEDETAGMASTYMLRWIPRFGLKSVPPIKLRSLKRSWGLCRIDGRITLHRALSRLHPEFFEYVLVHELCHLFHMNHGSEFKTLLTEMIPHWREIKRNHEPVLF